MSTTALISCLCVSENRADCLQDAIRYFLGQTYPQKELIIVSRNFDQDYKNIVDSLGRENIKYYSSPTSQLTLGELRNFAIEKSGGDYWCVWDDDDWYHMERLEMQYAQIVQSRKNAVILAYNLMFDKQKNEAYMSKPLNMPGTILCVKNHLKYPSMNISEDLHFLRSLYAENILFPLIRPTLYIYIYHGTNTCTTEYFRSLFKNSQRLPARMSNDIYEIISNKYSYQEGCKMIDKTEILRELDYCRPSEFFA